MKKIFKLFISVLCAVVMALPILLISACGEKAEHVDYVGNLHLDFSTKTKKQEVTVRTFIDGDTTHFDPVTDSTITPYNAADFASTQGYIKARYLAINTPESTGQIEEWGKKASKFTRSKLEDVDSIVVESDVDYWDIDSTGERYLLWVWYKPKGATEYRNLNVEILQEGLAFASRTSNGIYGSIAQKALDQAMAEKLYLYSGEKDPDFYYGAIKYVSLKELRCFSEEYNGVKVSVQGTVVAQFNNSVFIESYDEDSEIYFGMQVFYGYSPPNGVLDVLKIGNKVEVVGTFAYSDVVNLYQISGLAAINPFNPNDPSNCKVIEEGATPDFATWSPAKYKLTDTVKIDTGREDEEGEPIVVEMLYGEATQNTSVTVENLEVTRFSTTNNGGDSDGAMTLYCKVGNIEVQVRTEVLYDDANNLVTGDAYKGKTITVKGMVEKFTMNGNTTYQIKVYRTDFITIVS